MSALKVIVKYEYLADIRSKNFWIQTTVFPIIIMLLSALVVYLNISPQHSVHNTSHSANVAPLILSPSDLGMTVGSLLFFFLLLFGTMIFSRVKREKTNRLSEIFASSVSGKDMMLGKILSVALLGITQIIVWFAVALLVLAFTENISVLRMICLPHQDINSIIPVLSCIAFLVGGYIFYASLFAVCGALTGPDGENHSYLNALTTILLVSYYIGQSAANDPNSLLSQVCSFVPFTSTIVSSVMATSGDTSLWLTLARLVVLFATSTVSLSLAGKVYKATIMMKGKKISPSDIITFLKIK